MLIPFTQYLLPDGRKRSVAVDCPEGKEDIVTDLLAEGAIFESEILRTGEVSLTVEMDDRGTLAREICNNGPEVQEALVSLITRAYEAL